MGNVFGLIAHQMGYQPIPENIPAVQALNHNVLANANVPNVPLQGAAIQPMQQPIPDDNPQPAANPQPAIAANPIDVIQAIADDRRLDEVRNQDRRKCLDMLYVKTMGKFIDDSYEAYCSALLNDYLDANHIANYTIRRQLLEGVFEEHLAERCQRGMRYLPGVIDTIDRINADTIGVGYYRPIWGLGLVVKTKRLTTKTMHNPNINLNAIAPPSIPIYINLSPYIVPVIGVVVCALTAKSVITHLLPNQSLSTITHNVAKQHVQHIIRDTGQNYCLSMIRV